MALSPIITTVLLVIFIVELIVVVKSQSFKFTISSGLSLLKTLLDAYAGQKFIGKNKQTFHDRELEIISEESDFAREIQNLAAKKSQSKLETSILLVLVSQFLACNTNLFCSQD